MLSREALTVGTLVIAGSLLAFVMSCDTVKRHKVLSFFFDGVPSLEETSASEEAVVKAKSEVSKTKQLQSDTERYKYAHGQGRDCKLCHKRRDKSWWSRPEFVKPVPELCYGCHRNFTTTVAYVHGPVAVGACTFCHNPHTSKFDYLLKKQVPELCYQCHDSALIKLIPDHSAVSSSGCTTCHQAHSSSERALLKPDWKVKAD